MGDDRTPPHGRRALSTYLRSIARYPLLTTSGEHRLARRTRRGERRARNELVQANLRLVVKIAREYADGQAPLEDLISEGNLGLIEAARRYDPERGVRFAAYASWWIRKFVRRALQRHQRDAAAPIYGADCAGRRGAIRLWRRLRSLEEAVTGTSGEVRLLSRVPAPEPGPEESLGEAEIAKLLRELVARLPDNERKIVEGRYGLTGERPRTLTEVGAELGFTREWARQLELRALGRLRRMLRRPR